MASWSPSPSPTTPSPLQATAVSDCPQCGSVCVGGLLLPCGHLTCRKCLRDHHGSQLTCHTCQHRLPLPKDQGSADFTSLVQQLGVDPVMALMVNQRLRGQGRQACLSCENNVSTTLCQDCNEFYCHSCARIHGRQRATRDHVMQPLPQALRNVSSADSADYAVPKPRTDSASSCDSMDIISNPMDQPKSRGPSRGSTRWKQWVRHEVGLLQAALSDQDALVTGLNDVLTVAEKRQTLLQWYAQSLSLFDVTQQGDDNTFNVTVAHDDVSMQVKLDSLQQRLRDVIVGPQDASFTSEVRQLIKQLDDVLSMQGNWSTSAQSITTQSVGVLQSITTQSVGVLQSITTQSVGVLQSSTTQSVGVLQSSTTQSVGVLQSSTTQSVGVLQSSTTQSVGLLQSSTTQSVGVLQSSTTQSVDLLQSSTTQSVGVLQSSTTQSVDLLQSSTASSQTSVTSPSLSSSPFATPTVNMSTPTSSAATPTSTAWKTVLNMSTPTSFASTPANSAVTPTSTVSKTSFIMSTLAATPTSNVIKTTNTMAVKLTTSTLVATTIISNYPAMPSNTATTPTTVSFGTGAPTANTATMVATPTDATVNAFTTTSSVATPTNNAVTPTNNAVTPTNNAVTPTNTTNVTVTPTNTSAQHAATTNTNATPTTNTFTAISSSAKPTYFTAISSAITAFTDISPATTTAATITVTANTSTPISSVATPTTTLDTKQKSTKNIITYSNTTAPPTVNQATPTSTTVTNPSMSSTKDRPTSNRTSITKPGIATDTTTTTKDKTTLADTTTTTNDKPTLANTTTTTNDKPTLANTTTTTKDKPTLANTTPTNTVGATPSNTTTASPVCATTSTCTPSVDPMTARPRRAFSVRPVCDDDSRKPFITSIISTRDGQRLVMTDSNNDKVKVLDLHPPHKVSAALNVIEETWCLALLPDDLVAMTTYRPVIYLLKITDSVTVTSHIQTDVTYSGVGGLNDGRLIVSCERDDNKGVARVDIITRDGKVVTTITDTNTLTRLDSPWYLSVVDYNVLLSDCVSQVVYKVDISSGHLVDTFTHPDLRYPRQLTADGSGNVYIASEYGQCVLVQSRKLVEASQHSDEGYDRPRGLCLTSDGRLVVAWSKVNSDSVVITYDLSSMLVATPIINNSAVMPANAVSFTASARHPTTVSTVATPTAATVNALTTSSSAATRTNNSVMPTNTAVLPTDNQATPTNTVETNFKSTINSTTPSNTAATDNQATPMSTSVTNHPMATNKDGATSTIPKSVMASRNTKTTTRDEEASTSDSATPIRNTTRTTKDGATTTRNTTSTTRDGATVAITTTPSPACATTSTCTPSVDPMTARPRRAFSVRPVFAGDSRKPYITSIISTRDGQRLVMTDLINDKVKVVDLHYPYEVSAALTVIKKPHCLALLPDGLVTMTTYSPVIYFMEITDTVTVTSRIKTDVTYRGVGGLSDGRLIVSCDRDDNNDVARVDIITRDGNVVTTITDTNTLTRLDSPWYLSVVDSHVLLSDLFSNAVYKVDIGSGHLVDTFTHADLNDPCQLTADGSGNVYIASEDGQCVLVRSAGGQWRKLVEASQHINEGYDKPRGVCLTIDGRLVVAWSKGLSDSVLIAYDL